MQGAGRVAFSNQQSYIAAISARFVQLQHGDIDKRVEVKPYVLDDQMCDECQGQRCGGKFAPFFCANVTCLQVGCSTLYPHIKLFISDYFSHRIVFLRALLGPYPLAVRTRVPQAPRQGGCRPAPGSALSLVLTPAPTINIDCSG